jgi:sialate O-acetylesterase
MIRQARRTIDLLLMLIGFGGLLLTSGLAQNTSFHWPGNARAAVALTYDDGIDVHLDHAVPDLEAAGFRGTFYVPANSQSLRSRMEEWRQIARRGHELGNHTLIHPCLRKVPGRERTFVTPERDLDRYTIARMKSELDLTNTLLFAVDGQPARTFAYPCGDETIGGESYVGAIRPLFPAARAYSSTEFADPRTVDLYRVPSWNVAGLPAEEMIAWVEKAVAARALAVITFHGVGGGHGLNVDRKEHQKLLAWLNGNRDRIWTAGFLTAARHIAGERKRLGLAP